MEVTSASCVGGSNHRSDQVTSGHKIKRVFISISRFHVTNVHFTLRGAPLTTAVVSTHSGYSWVFFNHYRNVKFRQVSCPNSWLGNYIKQSNYRALNTPLLPEVVSDFHLGPFSFEFSVNKRCSSAAMRGLVVPPVFKTLAIRACIPMTNSFFFLLLTPWRIIKPLPFSST